MNDKNKSHDSERDSSIEANADGNNEPNQANSNVFDTSVINRCGAEQSVYWLIAAKKTVFSDPLQWLSAMAMLMFIIIFSSALQTIGQFFFMATSYVWLAGLLNGCHQAVNSGRFTSLALFSGFKQSSLSSLIILSVLIGVINTSILMYFLADFYQELIPYAGNQQQLQAYINDNIERFTRPLLTALFYVLPVFVTSLLVAGVLVFGNNRLLNAIVISIKAVAINIIPLVLWLLMITMSYLLMTFVLLLGPLGVLVFPILMLYLLAIFTASIYQMLLSMFGRKPESRDRLIV
ncbi:MAG: hypothetical protein V2I33_03735 [Kangiellaceae bacterium]|jgi:hypothetical protein|nr:hypothetical protein [Kangiellaceae bacterium]